MTNYQYQLGHQAMLPGTPLKQTLHFRWSLEPPSVYLYLEVNLVWECLLSAFPLVWLSGTYPKNELRSSDWYYSVRISLGFGISLYPVYDLDIFLEKIQWHNFKFTEVTNLRKQLISDIRVDQYEKCMGVSFVTWPVSQYSITSFSDFGCLPRCLELFSLNVHQNCSQ